ncbi:hypothetical protein MU1_10710 [Paenibacillus glycanilyticus]|uniref:Uncharacterized protein n=1 Tax=Paenibacillus glycanilyticus TaxID=126569 RepID=A0ABQ6GCC7_9BACL|nr:hypothetical protein MU1_10710 [Paenibacillus glycanilyticus]
MENVHHRHPSPGHVRTWPTLQSGLAWLEEIVGIGVLERAFIIKKQAGIRVEQAEVMDAGFLHPVME